MLEIQWMGRMRAGLPATIKPTRVEAVVEQPRARAVRSASRARAAASRRAVA